MSSVRGQEMGLVPGQSTGRRLRVAEVIGAQIESATRFKSADLKELAPDAEGTADLVVTTRQRVDLDIDTAEHPGPLAPGITRIASPMAMDAELQQRLATAESAAASRIQHWAAEEPGRYRRLLSGAELFGDQASEETLGVDWSCTTCAQAGRVSCGACEGRGAATCPDCLGRRRCACRGCRGLGRMACGVCEGRGLTRAAPTAAGPVDPASAPTAGPPDTAAMVPCAACSQGWLSCTTCAGQGESDCVRCQASGTLVCPDCQGHRTLDCPDCKATGWRHRWGRLRARLDVEDLLELHHPDPAIAAAIASRYTDVTSLDTVCAVEQVRYTTAPLAVQAVHRLKLSVRQARLQVAGQSMQFVALGPSLDIVDLQGIASVLLLHDLATLEKNTAGTGRHLTGALQRFLQSPLNSEIALRALSPDSAQQHPGLVDDAYPPRALAAVRHAVERLWLQRVWRPRLLCLAGIGVVAALAVLLGSPDLGWVTAAGLALGAGVMAWTLIDWQVRQALARSLQMPESDRLLRPLRRSALVRHWQLTSLAAAALVALASAGAMTRLPRIQQQAQQAQAIHTLDQQLDAWLVSEGKDFSLRQYPDAAALDQAIARTPADPRAQLVRAWQLVLGTRGVSPDPRAAEQLLEGLAAGRQVSSAAVIAQARVTLALNGRSAAALQAAASSLEKLPDPQPAEALYTAALLQLHPVLAARLGGPQQGLTTLLQAADQGHASACFELGRRLAGGIGLRRDPVGARRYLGYAQAKGVPGAADAMTTLR